MSLINEIREQPEVLKKQLKKEKSNVLDIAKEIKKYNPEIVHLIARGTSDHAGIYGQYLFGIQNKIPFSLACPSLATFYGGIPHFTKSLTIGISQSGMSPDLIAVIDDCKKQGSPSLVITNTPKSPLGEMADYVIDCVAGPEKATAATKSYTTSLMGLAMLSAALKDDSKMFEELEKVPEWVAEALKLEDQAEDVSKYYAYVQRSVVLGRGYNYATAKEWGLKIQELTYTMAEAYSSADFQHGPIAMVENRFPVFAAAFEGKVLDSMLPQLTTISTQLKGNLCSITNSDKVAALSTNTFRISKDIPEWLTPFVGIIPAQLFAYHLCISKGQNTETPRTIAKVTETH